VPPPGRRGRKPEKGKRLCLWHTPGEKPTELRRVLAVDPAGEERPQAFFGTDTRMPPARIVEVFVMRWNVEIYR
jgi:hypothetical protein